MMERTSLAMVSQLTEAISILKTRSDELEANVRKYKILAESTLQAVAIVEQMETQSAEDKLK
jgi:hypothetical protein